MIILDVQILPQVQLIAPTAEETDLVEDEELFICDAVSDPILDEQYAGLDKSAVRYLRATEVTAAEGNKILS